MPGPAAANLMGGIVNSWGDSVPVLFLAGHNDRTKIASKFTKEIPFLEIFGPVSKWSAMIDDPSKVAETLRRAFMHHAHRAAGAGRARRAASTSRRWRSAISNIVPVSPRPRVRSGADPEAINAAIDLIGNAERPYVYVGAGVLFSEATDELVRFAELLTLPVATTLNGKSAFPEDHPLALGIGGFGRASYGSLPATVIGESADVILTVGCGFKQHATRGAAEPAHQAHPGRRRSDRDQPRPCGRCRDPRRCQGRAAAAGRGRQGAAAGRAARAGRAAVQGDSRSSRQRWASVCEPLLDSEETPINPFRVTREFMKLVDPARDHRAA